MSISKDKDVTTWREFNNRKVYLRQSFIFHCHICYRTFYRRYMVWQIYLLSVSLAGQQYDGGIDRKPDHAYVDSYDRRGLRWERRL